MSATDETRDELEAQLMYYDREARIHSYAYRGIKIFNGGSAAVVSLLVGAGVAAANPLLPASLAALVAILEIVDHVNDTRGTWIRSRLAAEQLRRERTLYNGRGGPYRGVTDRQPLLAERMSEIRTREGVEWRKAQMKASAEGHDEAPQA